MPTLLSFLLVAIVVSQQEPAAGRDNAFGIARRSDRTPWAGATVRFLSEPFPGAEPDVVEVVSDAAGRFRAGILSGVPYTVWAWAEGVDEWVVSQRVADAVPGLPIVLDEHHGEPRVRLRLKGLDAWNLARSTAWCAGADDGALAARVPIAADGEVELPPTGTGSRWLSLHTGTGLDLLRTQVPADVRGAFEWILPPPCDVAVVVSTPEGTAVADARLEIRGARTTVLPPRTDDKGCMTAVLPQGIDFAARQPLWATAAGCLESRLWARKRGETEPLRAFVTPHAVPRATLAWRDGQPLVDVPIWLGGVEKTIQPDTNGTKGRANPQFARNGSLRTDAAGAVSLPYATDYPMSIATVLPQAELEHRHGGAISPLVLLFAEVPAAGALALRVDALRPVRFVFEHADHTPAQRAHVRVGGGASPGIGLDYVANQAGSVAVLVPPQDDIMVAVWHDGAGDVVKVAVPPAREAGIAVVRVRLPAAIRVAGRVVDTDGKPVAGAAVRTGTTLQGERSDWQAVEEGADGRPDAPHVVARGFYYPPMAEPMFARSVVTGDDGRFELMLPGRGFPLAFCAAHGPHRSETEWRAGEAAGEVGEVLLVLR